MALPLSGQLGLSSIATSVGAVVPYSLRNMSATAGLSTPDAISEFYGYGGVGYSYSATTISFPSTNAGYTLYAGSFTNVDDGYSTTAIALPIAFSMNSVSSTSLYVGTNGYVTLASGIGSILSSPTTANPAVIAGNPGDQWLQPGLALSDGTTQNVYSQTNNIGSGKYNIKLIIYCGQYAATSTPQSYVLNFYKDNIYQWVETRVKSNTRGGDAGPYNVTSVAQLASTTSKVWRGDLTGRNWVYLGTGSVI